MTSENRRLWRLLLVIFLFGGASALAYEVIWMRLLSLTFGVSVYAVSSVLTAFMGGLALGSWWFGRLASRRPDPAFLVKLYAAMQVGIAAFAVLAPWIFSQMTRAFVQVDDWFHPGFRTFNLIRFTLAALVLLIPTSLMGGTFPVLGQVLGGPRQDRGDLLGRLYAANTFGGVLGALAAGLVLIRVLGVKNSVLLVAGVDLLLAAATIALALPLARRVKAPAAGSAVGRAPSERPKNGLILWVFALSGLAALGYEVLWTRILAMSSLNAVFSFTIMLATFLVGIAVGSRIVSSRADRVARPRHLFGYLQLGIGLAGILALHMFARLPEILAAILTADTVRKQLLSEFIAAGLTMLPSTLLIGATFPVAARLYTGSAESVGRPLGRLYAFNTVGAMLGAFLAAFVLIPWAGLQRGALLLGLLNLTLGTLMFVSAAPVPRAAVAGMLASSLAAAVLLPPGMYLGAVDPANEPIFYKEGVDATVSVFRLDRQPPIKISFVNGRSEVPTDRISMRAFYFLGHMPPLLNPDARSALMVSFGNGIATGAMSRHGLDRIQAVELVQGQVEAAQLYRPENRDVLDYPGLSIEIDDGRNYLLRSSEKFDIITADATHPINTSSWALFTRQFYTLVRDHMSPGAVFVQWLPFHDLAISDYKDIIKTCRSVFPTTTLWYSGGPHTFLVVTPEAFTADRLAALERRIAASGVGDDLQGFKPLGRAFLMDSAEVADYVSGARVVEDGDAFFMPSHDLEQILRSFVKYAGDRPAR